MALYKCCIIIFFDPGTQFPGKKNYAIIIIIIIINMILKTQSHVLE